MINTTTVYSYERLIDELNRQTQKNNRILILFCGALDGNGESWCSDCRKAIPIVQQVMEQHSGEDIEIYFIFVSIDRDEWKNPSNKYRTDGSFRVTNVPTLICWEQGVEKGRLVEDECTSPELLGPYFKK